MKKVLSHFLVLFALLLPAWSMAQFSLNVSVNVAPPELPVYDQPPIPGDGYIWTPGFWAWSDDDQDYYWVPGTWIEAPQPGYLWTPGYWAFNNGAYLWNPGYWGPVVGFYGGVNYGYGYGGAGFEGGYWQGGHLFYNRSVTNVGNVHITNVYNKTVINNVTVNRVSFNGGSGGIQARPSPAQMAAAHDHHIEATSAQRQQVSMAHSNPSLRASQNNGHPPIAATSRPGNFSGAGVVGARGAEHGAPPERNAYQGVQHNGPAEQRNGPAEQHNSPPPVQHNEAPRVENQPRNVPAPAVHQAPATPHPAAPHPAQHPPEHEDHDHH